MKNAFAIIGLVLFIAACNNEETPDTTKTDTTAAQTLDSVVREMKRVEDCAKRAMDSASVRK